MKIYYRPVNSGETFCVSVKTAKSIFKDTNVKLCFGEFQRHYIPHNNEFGYAYWKKNISGAVVAQTILEPGVDCPLLCFYVVKSTDVSPSLKNDFEKVLCSLFETYNQFINSEISRQQKTIIWVEMIDNRFHVHRFTL